MSKNKEVAVAFAQKFVDEGILESYDLEEAGDVVEVADVSVDKDVLFVFGEFMSVLVLVQDGVVVNWAVGGFEDNRGHTIECEFQDKDGRDIDFDRSGDDPDKEYQEIYTAVLSWLRG